MQPNPPPADLRRAQDELVRECRGLADRGLVLAAAGNASVAVGDAVLLTSTGAAFATLGPADLTLVDRSGTVLSGDRPPDLRARAAPGGVRAPGHARRVVHAHGRHAVALSAVADVVPALHYYASTSAAPSRWRPTAASAPPSWPRSPPPRWRAAPASSWHTTAA